MADITFDCPECKKSLTIDAAGAGLSVPCPQCARSIVVPATSAPPPMPAALPSAKPEARVFCRNCAQAVHAKAVACPACGVPPQAENKFCSSCGSPTQPKQVLCVACGTSLTPQPAPGGSTNKIAAGLFGIFLGGLGIHKFYLGYTKEAVIMLLVSIVGGIITCGVAYGVMGIIGLIEGIIYLTKTDVEFDKIYVQAQHTWF